MFFKFNIKLLFNLFILELFIFVFSIYFSFNSFISHTFILKKENSLLESQLFNLRNNLLSKKQENTLDKRFNQDAFFYLVNLFKEHFFSLDALYILSGLSNNIRLTSFNYSDDSLILLGYVDSYKEIDLFKNRVLHYKQFSYFNIVEFKDADKGYSFSVEISISSKVGRLV